MIDEKMFRAINSNILVVMGFLFPGVFILETIYQTGLFSGGIKTVWDFLLLLLWSIAISAPYKILCVFSTRFHIQFGVPKNQRSALVHQGAIYPFLVVLPLISYAAFRFLAFVNPFDILTFKHFPPTHALFLLAFFITTIIAVATGPLYKWLALRLTRTYISPRREE